jgi:hypothetical protein
MHIGLTGLAMNRTLGGEVVARRRIIGRIRML